METKYVEWDQVRDFFFGRRFPYGHHLILAHRGAGKSTLALDIGTMALEFVETGMKNSVGFYRGYHGMGGFIAHDIVVVDGLGWLRPPSKKFPRGITLTAIFHTPASVEEFEGLLKRGSEDRFNSAFIVPLSENHFAYDRIQSNLKSLPEAVVKAQFMMNGA